MSTDMPHLPSSSLSPLRRCLACRLPCLDRPCLDVSSMHRSTMPRCFVGVSSRSLMRITRRRSPHPIHTPSTPHPRHHVATSPRPASHVHSACSLSLRCARCMQPQLAPPNASLNILAASLRLASGGLTPSDNAAMVPPVVSDVMPSGSSPWSSPCC